MALALANEVRSFGIRVSVLMPGDVATGFTVTEETTAAIPTITASTCPPPSNARRNIRTGEANGTSQYITLTVVKTHGRYCSFLKETISQQ